ncbi:sensor histidine kinase [Granulosicoccus antarcticus]|uniref:histidine kinase n=1 Tax=Granulosicoccus antarcticus IMCC3135 TaxID=1192854 RepID=A0A2Z2NIA2_9GAMM|nr:histidine kinase dimerization/phospho-acceptor domain-containing protein [Granulosicoccus antarcticus]ASJ70869.1 Sensor histidine kinase RcsC [Granulosicoccus antarcticus IMCC3135]
MIKGCEQSIDLAACVRRQWPQQIEHAVFVVNKDNRVLFAKGSTDNFVQHDFSGLSTELPDITIVARRGLKSRLRPLLSRVWRNETPVNTPARAYRNGTYHHCHVHISKLEGCQDNDNVLMVLLHPNYPDRDNAKIAEGHASFPIDSDQVIRKNHDHVKSLQQARRMSVAANDSKNMFLANMSREIRTPMTAILGYTDLLIEKEPNNETLQYLQTINRNAENLLSIINDVLDLSKIEAGNIEPSKKSFSPTELMVDISDTVSLRARMKRISLECNWSPDIPALIQTDQKLLKRIIINLIGNAIKFTDKGGVTLLIQYEPEKLASSNFESGGKSLQGGTLNFIVKDTGVGIGAEQKYRLLKLLSEPGTELSQQDPDQGLGLVISQNLARKLGGSISCESEAGKGSIFTLSIPVPDTPAIIPRVSGAPFIRQPLRTQ